MLFSKAQESSINAKASSLQDQEQKLIAQNKVPPFSPSHSPITIFIYLY